MTTPKSNIETHCFVGEGFGTLADAVEYAEREANAAELSHRFRHVSVSTTSGYANGGWYHVITIVVSVEVA